MPLNILDSVGSGGTNSSADVMIIQQLLNGVPAASGGPATNLEENGSMDQHTLDAIEEFQEKRGLPVTGLVEPDSSTLNQLNTFEIAMVSFWINAFIPSVIDGLTLPVPGSSGKTMLTGPVPLSNDCFHTDCRDFSDDTDASSRVHSHVTIEFHPGFVGLSEIHHRCSPTIMCSCSDGSETCNAVGDTSDMGFRLLPSSSTRVGIVEIKAAASNPCIDGAPAIDYFGILTITLASRSVGFEGFLDGFPAFEAYARINDGPPAFFFRSLPPAGATPFNLIGSATRDFQIELLDADGDGIFEIRSVTLEP